MVSTLLLGASSLCVLVAGAVAFCIEDGVLQKDVSLSSTAFNYHTHSDIYMCASSCLMALLCQSFHLEVETRRCVLFHRNSSQMDLTSRLGVVFSDISHWPQSLAGSCSNSNCSNIRRCVPLRKGGFECDILKVVDVGETKSKSYRTITKIKTWQSADKRCEKLGGQLWVISTQRELSFLEGLFTDAGRLDQSFWVGVRLTNDGWKWLNSDHVTVDQWGADEPLSKGDCAVIKFGSGLATEDCAQYHSYICEFKGPG